MQFGAGGRVHDRFELISPIGAGGIATVWRAVDRDGRDVALKVLHPHLRKDRVIAERFRREVEVCRSIGHPAIVRAFELFEDEESLFFSLELLHGQTLKDAILTRGPLSALEVERIARTRLAGLSAAHGVGVVHRDFKPQNVFLCTSGEIRLLDFGFARIAATAGFTQKSHVLLTPEYAAPELIQGASVDGRADLYSLGVSLYEALTCRLPHRGKTAFEILQQHLHLPPEPLSAVRSDLPPCMCATVMRLLCKSPEERFPTADTALAELAEARTIEIHTEAFVACAVCGEPKDRTWPICPACGATGDVAAGGDRMVVLMRMPKGSSRESLKSIVQSVGAVPRRELERVDPRPIAGLPKVILKGVAEPLARLVRERCQAKDLQVEIRSFKERNYDLLHQANTPGLILFLGLFVPWALLFFALVTSAIDEARRTGKIVCSTCLAGLVLLSVVGVAVARLVTWRAHLLLPPLSIMPKIQVGSSIPASLVERYRNALATVTNRSLHGTLVRLFGRTLIISSAKDKARPDARALLEEPHNLSLQLAAQAMDLAEAAQASLEQLEHFREDEIWAELAALRAKAAMEAGKEAEISILIREKEAELVAISRLEQGQALASQRLLRIASALELAAVRVVAASVPDASGITRELERFALETEIAATTARDMENLP
jgi:protein kinase-like protein